MVKRGDNKSGYGRKKPKELEMRAIERELDGDVERMIKKNSVRPDGKRDTERRGKGKKGAKSSLPFLFLVKHVKEWETGWWDGRFFIVTYFWSLTVWGICRRRRTHWMIQTRIGVS